MTDESRRFRLGLFTISGVVLLVAGILVVGAGRIFRSTDPMYCYFEESVQGLDRGSPVKFRGVEVGRVEEISVMPSARIAASTDAPAGASLIEVRTELFVDKISDEAPTLASRDQLRQSIEREVAQGLRVRIAWKDITGQKYLDLDYIDPKLSPKRVLPFEPPGTWIPTMIEKSISDIQRDVATVTSELAQVEYRAIANDLRALMASLKQRVDEMGSAEVAKRLGEAAQAVTDLAQNPKIDDALVKLNSTLDRLGSASGRLDDLLGKPELSQTFDDLAASAASVKRLTAEFETDLPRVTASVEETLALARRTIEAAKLPETTESARATLADVGTAARQLGALRDSARRALSEFGDASRGLAQLLRYLEENPEAFVQGKQEEVR